MKKNEEDDEEEDEDEEDDEEEQTPENKSDGSLEKTVRDQRGVRRVNHKVRHVKLTGEARMSIFHKSVSQESASDDNKVNYPNHVHRFRCRSSNEVYSERLACFKAPAFIQLPFLPPPAAPPPPDFLDDMNPGDPQQPYAHVNYPAVDENVGYMHNVVQQVLPGPQPHHHHPAPPPPDLLD